MSDSRQNAYRPSTTSAGSAPHAWFSERTKVRACGTTILGLTMLRYGWFGAPQTLWECTEDLFQVACGVWLLYMELFHEAAAD